ncbi:MAG: HesB/IscA family protein [Clostridia bacterium]
MEITITPAAEKAFTNLAGERGATYIRVWAGQACGCGRIGYRMAVEEGPEDQDTLIPAGSLNLVVAPECGPHLEGGVIDYIDEPLRSGFTIENPNVPSGCSCGGNH